MKIGYRVLDDVINKDSVVITKGGRYPLSDVYYVVREGDSPVVMPRMAYRKETEEEWQQLVDAERKHYV